MVERGREWFEGYVRDWCLGWYAAWLFGFVQPQRNCAVLGLR